MIKIEIMTDQYEGNGDYSNYGDGSSDFKRKNSTRSDPDDNDESNPVTEKTNEYIRDLLGEKVQIDHKYPNADRLIDQEISKVRESGKIPPRDLKYVDIYREKQIRVTVKVLVPVKEHPKFNFVGKLLGPKGNSMKRLQEETMCKMAVLGRGSMKDRKKEEELRASLDPKYGHLNDDLHVEISALAPPAEAHARIAYALAEVRKYLIPDNNDIIRQEQMREMLTEPGAPIEAIEAGHPPYKRVAVPPSRGYSYRPPIPAPSAHSPAAGGSTISGLQQRSVMPVKTKILSLLDRARSAMEDSYNIPVSTRGYEDPVVHYEPSPYDYSYSHAHAAPVSSRSRYEVPEYEADYRREYYRESPTYTVKPSSSSKPSWKPSSSYTSSSRHGHGHGHEESSSSKHSHSHSSSREARYRSSPYTRSSK